MIPMRPVTCYRGDPQGATEGHQMSAAVEFFIVFFSMFFIVVGVLSSTFMSCVSQFWMLDVVKKKEFN